MICSVNEIKGGKRESLGVFLGKLYNHIVVRVDDLDTRVLVSFYLMIGGLNELGLDSGWHLFKLRRCIRLHRGFPGKHKSLVNSLDISLFLTRFP